MDFLFLYYRYNTHLLPLYCLYNPVIIFVFFFFDSGKRKPDPEFYLEVVEHLGVEPCDCVFIDDRFVSF